MNSQHFGFFTSKENNIFGSTQGVFLASSTSSHGSGISYREKGMGTYLYLGNFRRSISLFCTRSLPKHSWKNSNDVYIGRIDNE